jgi:hypothetical protein
MRFAWIRENTADTVPVKQSNTRRLIFIAYNLVWWLPILLTFIGIIDYRTGFVAFFVITIIRAGANLCRNNVLTPEQAESFPLRAP